MSLNNLLNNATLIKTAIQPMNHNIPVILERKKMYLQAVAKYSYYPLQDEESTSTEFMSSKIFTQPLDGLEYGEAVLAIQPIPYLLDGDDLIQAFDKLSENLAQYIDTHRQIFAKAEKNGYFLGRKLGKIVLIKLYEEMLLSPSNLIEKLVKEDIMMSYDNLSIAILSKEGKELIRNENPEINPHAKTLYADLILKKDFEINMFV